MKYTEFESRLRNIVDLAHDSYTKGTTVELDDQPVFELKGLISEIEQSEVKEFDDSSGPIVEKGGIKIPKRALDALNKGQRIGAIKIIRAWKNIGLKEAKDFVDKFK